MVRATLEWIKDAVERRAIDDGASVPHLQEDFRVATGRCHTYRRVLRSRSVLNRIQNQIAKQLL
ncbi:hypothetical protein LMG28138_04682 [Pararobbsia alpina]|uniref:Uncharacterized protein n=1 Tax=Pararobbsia alpina TaxID=621374 RepID=A0A6S7BQY2_9BURK|nr:hypothetical protein LMG28138_04682 [Pararobbsia alpina]